MKPVRLQFCVFCLSFHGYVFIGVCAIWMMSYLVLAVHVPADKSHTCGGLGGFVEAVNDLKTRLN